MSSSLGGGEARLSSAGERSVGRVLPGRGALDEHLRHRALRCRSAAALDLVADGLTHGRALARRDAGEHPVHHRPGERVAVGEVLVGLNRQLVLAVGGPDPRSTDLHAPPAKRHRAVLVPVAAHGPVCVVPALRADDLVDLELHQLMDDAQAHAGGEPSNPSLAAPTSSPSASWTLAGSGLSGASIVVTTSGAGTFFAAVPPVLDGLQAPRTLPIAADGPEGPPLTVLRDRTTSSAAQDEQYGKARQQQTRVDRSPWGRRVGARAPPLSARDR
jgi:hypothetical protein